MVALEKYRVVMGGTAELYRQQRALIEEVLRDQTLSMAEFDELHHDLELAILAEKAAILADEEAKKDKEDDSGEGKKSGGSGGDARGTRVEDNKDDPAQPEEMEVLVLMFLLAEEDVVQPVIASNTVDHAEAVALTQEVDTALTLAATLLLDRREQVAHLRETIVIDPNNSTVKLSNALPEVEKRVAKTGMKIVQVKARPEAVGMLKKKFGYTPYGKIFSQGSETVQRMRKSVQPTSNQKIDPALPE